MEFSLFGTKFDGYFIVRLQAVIQPLRPRSVFRVSHGERAEVLNVFIRVEQDGVVGYGEASPNPVYGENAPDVLSRLENLAAWLKGRTVRDAADIGRVWVEAWPLLEPSRAAQCALDIALWDWLGRRRGSTVTELALAMAPRDVPSFCTIGLSAPGELDQKVAELRSHPFIKIKSDAAADISVVRRVRELTDARLAVDANCGWGNVDVAFLSRELFELGVVFIEQPLPPADYDRMPGILAASALPILADESCVVEEDVGCMPGHFSGFNIKLVKCGGITPALRMLARGRPMGLSIMVGCMLESSLLIAAGAVIAARTDFADLDGAWLLRDDPFRGLEFKKGILRPSGAPGLGVEPVGLRFDS